MTTGRAFLRRVLVSTATGTVLLTTLATLFLGFALKSRCLLSWPPGHQPKTCYNDIQTLWNDRDMAAKQPPYSGEVVTRYVDGHLKGVHLGAGQIEYPVLTGLFAWVTSLPASGPAGYLVVSALALTPFALVSSLALARLAGTRYLLFAISPQLAAYAFLNWDLLPVAAVVLAVLAWRKDRTLLAAVLLSLGACAKLWPGFMLLPLTLHLLTLRRFRAAAAAVGAAVLTATAVNLPFLLTNPRGWAAPYLMQSVRANDSTTNSIWTAIAYHAEFRLLNTWAALAVLAGWLAAVLAGERIRRARGEYPWIQVSAAMVVGYIVLGRVDSPQYGLWLLPFLVLLAVPAGWVASFMVTDMFLWLVWSWLWGTPHWVHVTAPVLRALALVGLAVVFLRSPLAFGGRSVSHALSRPPVPPDPSPARRPGAGTGAASGRPAAR